MSSPESVRFFFLYVLVVWLHACSAPCACLVVLEVREDTRLPETEAIGGWVSPCGCWEPRSSTTIVSSLKHQAISLVSGMWTFLTKPPSAAHKESQLKFKLLWRQRDTYPEGWYKLHAREFGYQLGKHGDKSLDKSNNSWPLKRRLWNKVKRKEKDNTNNQNLWGMAKVFWRDKFIAITSYN